MPQLRLLIVAGERSGDIYGAELARNLQTRLDGVEIFGCGGDAMRRAKVETVIDAHDISSAGLVENLTALPRAYRAFRQLVQVIDRRPPQLGVLIDFPSFNLRLAKKLKERRIAVVYFVSPQIWAWKSWRIKGIKACVDKMLCIFDFEERIYREAGVPVEYIGHPLVDLARPRVSREEFFERARLDPAIPTVALLPGSREMEVSYNLPPMLDAASRLSLRRKIQFVIAAAPTLQVTWLERLQARCYVGREDVRIVPNAALEALQYSELAVVASGTATVEALLSERPMIVVYRVSPISWFFGKFMVKVPFFSMVNLLAGKAIVPELVQRDFTGENVVREVERLLEDAAARQAMVQEFRALKPRLGPGGAIGRAADAVIKVLGRRPGWDTTVGAGD